MRSLIFSTAARLLLPLLLLFSLILLFRGHNEPGGGFVGGLVASAGLSLYALAFGVEQARQMLRLQPRVFIGGGLAMALASGMLSLLAGDPYLTGIWSSSRFPVVGKLGTPFFFDAGVYLVVIGVMLMIIFSLMED